MGYFKNQIDFTTISLEDLKWIIYSQISYKNHSKSTSNEFCGIYFHGHDSPFLLSEHEVPIKAFRFFSQKSYPIFLFCYRIDSPELCDLVENYENIKIIPLLRPMKSINDYDEFVIHKLFQYYIPENFNRTLTFHHDGFLINHGWEEFVTQYDFDYIGAPWCGFPTSDVILPEFQFEYNIVEKSSVGNGGFCYRKRNKCLEVCRRVDSRHLNWKYTKKNLPDDVYFSYFGFGLHVFKHVPLDLAFKWAQEPIENFESFGFHRTYDLARKLQSRKDPSST